MQKRWWIIIIIGVLVLLGCFIYRDQTRCYEIQRRCSTIYDLSTIENVEDIDFYRGLNEKCMGKCGTAKLRLNIKKWWCVYEYKEYKERAKDRRYFRPDTYNPCPELYTLRELNSFLEK